MGLMAERSRLQELRLKAEECLVIASSHDETEFVAIFDSTDLGKTRSRRLRGPGRMFSSRCTGEAISRHTSSSQTISKSGIKRV